MSRRGTPLIVSRLLWSVKSCRGAAACMHRLCWVGTRSCSCHVSNRGHVPDSAAFKTLGGKAGIGCVAQPQEGALLMSTTFRRLVFGWLFPRLLNAAEDDVCDQNDLQRVCWGAVVDRLAVQDGMPGQMRNGGSGICGDRRANRTHFGREIGA